MLFIVDGTGDSDTAAYMREMSSSFCHRLYRANQPNSWYRRGPTLTGLETGALGAEVASAASAVARTAAPRGPEKIYFCGYSRGGAAVIHAARLIYPQTVKAIFLFDAVDMTLGLQVETVPGNVERVYHAMRDRSFSSLDPATIAASRKAMQDQTLAPRGSSLMQEVRASLLGGPPEHDARARRAIDANALVTLQQRLRQEAGRNSGLMNEWGNCGTAVMRTGSLVQRTFAGSHGAMGGVPWNEIQGDGQMSAAVFAWMSKHLLHEGLRL